jgi:hypothetical protein
MGLQGYQKKPTQEQRILKLLRDRGKSGAYVWEFMMPSNQGGLGIAQYNARIYGLRKKGFKIENKTPGHFVLLPQDPVQETLSL